MTTSHNKVTFSQLLKRPACLLAYGFGSGLSPKAPGTMGTLVALPIYWLIQDVGLLSYLLITVVAFIAGIWICQQAVNWLEKDDPSAVVWDEIVGYLVTMIAAPAGWQWMLWALYCSDSLISGSHGQYHGPTVNYMVVLALCWMM